MIWLAAVGRNATNWLAVGIFAGLLVPPLADLARPLLTPAIFLVVVTTVLRLDPAALRASLARPRLIAAAVLWVLFGAPLIVLPFARLTGGFFGDHAILLAASAPLLSSAAYALILRLDAAFALAVGVIATALVPLTLPPLVGLVLGVELALSPWHLLARLTLLVGGAGAVALAIRALTSAPARATHAAAIDGVTVLAMLAFGTAAMAGVTRTAFADPGFVLGCIAAVFALAFGLNAAATLVFARFGWRIAMTMGLVAGFKNLGIVVAAMGASAPDRTVVFLGVAQLPIYLLPWLLERVLRRRPAALRP